MPKKQKTHEEFIEQVKMQVDEEYTVLGKYEKYHSKIKMKHNICGFEYDVAPSKFLSGRRCPNCFGKFKKTTEQFKKEVFDLAGDEYVVLGEYQGKDTKIKMYHAKCNNFIEMRPHGFLGGKRCRICFRYEKRNIDQFKKEVYEAAGAEYTVLGEYKNNKSKIKIRHNKCGTEFEMAPDNFLNQHQRCPNCKSSHGEVKIKQWLDNYKIKYKHQFKIEECKRINALPFDFAVFKGKDLQCLIEFDGLQHFKPVKAFGGKEALEETKLRDKIKTQYCEKNNIKLIRIPYTKLKQIDNILQSALL